jgi:hypothetical protein
VSFLACGEVRSLGPSAISDAGEDGSRGSGSTDSASDVTLRDVQPSLDVALDGRRQFFDAGDGAIGEGVDASSHDTGVDAIDDAGADVAPDAQGADAFVESGPGHDGSAWPPDGYFTDVPPDAQWLVDAAVDASSCATVAAALCARAGACPARLSDQGVCFHVAPETLCFGTYAGCVAYFSLCISTSSPPPSELTLIPDLAACAAALAPDNCVRQGEDYDYEMPTSCAVCPPPWDTEPNCPFHLADAGADTGF